MLTIRLTSAPATFLMLIFLLVTTINAQQVEVQGELKVAQMTTDATGSNLVTRKEDGTLGTRSVSSLLSFASDTTRTLASDLELAKFLCDCQNVPPFLIEQLLESGYTIENLVEAGIPVEEILDAVKFGQLFDSRDNQIYKTVTIGTQTWMAENLNIGTRIDGTTASTNNGTIEKYCQENDPNFCVTFGGLYTWDESMQYSFTEGTQGICPDGWHLPTDAEWMVLEEFLGMCSGTGSGCSESTGARGTNQGSQLAGSQLLWSSSAISTDPEFGLSGFDAKPGGYKTSSGSLTHLYESAFFWTSKVSTGSNAWQRQIYTLDSEVYRNSFGRTEGYSVRCIKD